LDGRLTARDRRTTKIDLVLVVWATSGGQATIQKCGGPRLDLFGPRAIGRSSKTARIFAFLDVRPAAQGRKRPRRGLQLCWMAAGPPAATPHTTQIESIWVVWAVAASGPATIQQSCGPRLGLFRPWAAERFAKNDAAVKAHLFFYSLPFRALSVAPRRPRIAAKHESSPTDCATAASEWPEARAKARFPRESEFHRVSKKFQKIQGSFKFETP